MLYVEETHVDTKEDCRYWASEIEETDYESVGAIYRAMRSQYGRCVSKVYIDTMQNGVQATGWVFRGKVVNDENPYREPYKYVREVWVSVYEECDPEDPRALVRNKDGRRMPFRSKYIGGK
jgi:hypothetical protein